MITLAGTIGAGKTAWGGIIAEHFGTELLIEKVEGNPFLAKFYEDRSMLSIYRGTDRNGNSINPLVRAKHRWPMEIYFVKLIFRKLA